MTESRTHTMAQALMQLAQTLGAEPAAAAAAGGGTQPAGRDAETMASLIRALCPANATTTRAHDVAELVRALCPANEARTNPTAIASLIQALSPAAESGGRSRLQGLIAALCPVEPEERVAAITDDFAKGAADKLIDAVRRGVDRPAAGKLSPKQQQAIDVFRVLSPVERQPKMSADQAAEFVRALSPATRPAEEVGALIAALSPAQDKTINTAKDAERFIRALCPAGQVPAADVAQLVRALSPANDAAARRVESVSEIVVALSPANATERGAIVAALCPATDPTSRPTDIAALLRKVAPDMKPIEVLRTLSPAVSAE